MARRQITAQQATEKWQRRMSTAGEDYSEGVKAVTDSPTQAAAAAKQKYVAGVEAAARSGRYERGLEAVSLEEWKQKAIEKGAGRLASGAQAAVPKVRQRMEQILANGRDVQQIVHQMPSDTPEQRMQRALVWMQEMHARPVK